MLADEVEEVKYRVHLHQVPQVPQVLQPNVDPRKESRRMYFRTNFNHYLDRNL